MSVILGMAACKKQDYSDDAWVVQATSERLEVKTYSKNSELLQTRYIDKKDQIRFDKSGLMKIEVRCGHCQYKVNGNDYRLDFAFFFDGKITSL